MNNSSNSKARKVAACALSAILTTGVAVGMASGASAAPVTNVVAAAVNTSTVVSPDGIAQVRSGPGVNFRSVTTLQNGNTVTVLETRDGWSRVGINQWVASWLLRPGNAAPSETLWRVQIGASQTKSRADNIASVARARGFKTFVRHIDGWYRVQVGAFSARENADRMVSRAQTAGFTDAFVRAD